MKIRNQSSLPSKYWLLIIAFFCVVLMGIEHATGGNGPLTFNGIHLRAPDFFNSSEARFTAVSSPVITV